jgi:hypothetical protein
MLMGQANFAQFCSCLLKVGGIEGLDVCMGEGFISVLYTNEIICY